MDRTTTTRRATLDTERIVAAGIELADAEGVDRLTMRRIAERLGFKVMALYNHVASKDELLSLMVDAVAGSIDPPPTEHTTTMGAVRAHALATRAAFVEHRWAPALWQRYLPGPNRIDHMERLLRALADSGLPAGAAHHGFHAVNNHVLGYTLQELTMEFDTAGRDAGATIDQFLSTVSPDTHPLTVAHVHQHLDGDTGSSFELVLDLILDGLATLPRDH
ncbi:MAG: TetR/AcrR family transcriptional regulator [Ilumatobacteraceae bacterium]|nr:TetR/AcrR family transcriptional regulator C-terminal domain-containing protein [Acidimicrobiales bacterium]